MRPLSQPRAIVAGVGWILLVNLILLGAAAWNRRGEPRAELSLTERELALPDGRQEGSAAIVLSLRLATRAPDVLQRAAWTRRVDLHRFHLNWFDREKLRELGFRVDVDPREPEAERHYNNAQFRRAWVVLEHDGEAWKRWIAEQEERLARLRLEVEAGTAEPSDVADAEAQLAFDRVARSRLVPVDVSRSAGWRGEKYADSRRFVILPAWVRPVRVERQQGRPEVLGVVGELLVQVVPVPRRQRPVLAPLMPTEKGHERWRRLREEARERWPEPSPPRYRAELAVGRSAGPWLVRVETTP